MNSTLKKTAFINFLLLLTLGVCVGYLVVSTTHNIPAQAYSPMVYNQTPVGLSTHALAVEGFPVDDLVEVVSVVKNVATTQLWDFPDQRTNLDNVRNTVSTLLANGHTVYHEIFIFNGPGARKGDEKFYNRHLTRPSTSRIRKAFLTNQAFRDAVTNYFAEVVLFAKELESMGVFVVICPELEDNQNSQSFAIMLDLLRQAGWTNEDGTLRREQTVRNASGTPSVLRETHSSNIRNLRPGDIYNNDGKAVSFTKRGSGYITPNSMTKKLIECQQRRVIGYIWLEGPQGYKKYYSGSSGLVRVYDGTRSHRRYTISHKEALKQMLIKTGTLIN